MSRDILPIEELLSRVRGTGELFDSEVEVDALSEGQGGGAEQTPGTGAEETGGEAEEERELPELFAEAERYMVEAEPADHTTAAGVDDPGEDDDYAPDEEESLAIGPMARPESEASIVQHNVYGEGRMFAAAVARLTQYLRMIARRIADGDKHFEDDLVQEALVELWEIDASRFDESDQMYLKRSLVTRMIRTAEREFAKGTGVRRAKLRAYLNGRARP